MAEQAPPSPEETGVATGLLRIYLRDHLAAAVGGTALAHRTLASNRETTFGPVLERIAAEVEEDRLTLEALMRRLGIGPDLVKIAAVWAFEKIGRLKPNGRVIGYSPLSRLIEFEALEAGIQSKRAMWTALLHVADRDGRLDPKELSGLTARAEDQRERVERIRLEAARMAFPA